MNKLTPNSTLALCFFFLSLSLADWGVEGAFKLVLTKD